MTLIPISCSAACGGYHHCQSGWVESWQAPVWGIALRGGGSSGGADILGMFITKRRQEFSVGRLNLIINCCIYLACALLFDIKVVIYCIIYSAASALALDKTHTQNISTGVFIFTKEEPQRVMAYILTDLVRGATYWEARGGLHEPGDEHYLYGSLQA